MMKAHWTDFAWSMLSQTADYILEEYGEMALDSFRNDVHACVKLLEEQPLIGPEEKYLSSRPLKYRSVVVGNHNKIVYTIDQEAAILFIVDFWDTRREPTWQSRSV